MRAILNLMYKLTVGTMVALGDFACRLPFWLKEYQIFTYADIPEEYLNTETHSDTYVSESPHTDTSTDTAENNADYENDDAYERLQRQHYGEEDLDEEEINLDQQERSVQSARSSRGKKYQDFENVQVVGSSGSWMSTLYA